MVIRLSWSTFRDRWQLFVGAIVAVAVGVALVQSSLLTLLAAVSPTIPADASWHDELVIREGYAGAVSLAAITMAIAAFVAVFVVGSTFAFTVSQRRRDFALLRLVGARPHQIRRLVRGEAVTLAVLGTIAGVPLGLRAARLQASMFIDFGLVPDGFRSQWHGWILAVSFGIGLVVAVSGATIASRRSGRSSPLDILRATHATDRVMNPARWCIGLLAAAGAVALVVTAPLIGGNAALDVAVPACLVAVVALTALAPTVVPLIGRGSERLTRRAFPNGALGELVHANLRDGVRRTASTAAPIILLVGLVTGLVGSLDIITHGQLTQARNTINADLVVTADRTVAPELATIAGIETASEETPILVQNSLQLSDGSHEAITNEALLVDPSAYESTHDMSGHRGHLASLAGDTVAISPNLAATLHADLGDHIDVTIEGAIHSLHVVAILPDRLAGPELLLPADEVATDGLEHHVLVRLTEGVDANEMATTITDRLKPASLTSSATSVQPFDDWVRNVTADRRGDSRDMIVAILAMSTIYIVISIINAIVIAAGDRREEFAVARLSGLTRTMVVRSAIAEAITVAVIGIALGVAAATTTLLGVTIAVSAIVGSIVIVLPWALLGLTAGAATVLVIATSTLTAIAATSNDAIQLAGARTT